VRGEEQGGREEGDGCVCGGWFSDGFRGLYRRGSMAVVDFSLT
jgi:hypothetical protein